MRLIDADEAKARIMMDAPDFMDGGSSITKAFIMAMLGTRSAIPTIDAVPVVRCNDCEYWEYDDETEEGFCNHLKIRQNVHDWFCASGKKEQAVKWDG